MSFRRWDCSLSSRKKYIQDKTNRLTEEAQVQYESCKVMKINDRNNDPVILHRGKNWRWWGVCEPWCDNVKRGQRNRYCSIKYGMWKARQTFMPMKEIWRANDIHRKTKFCYARRWWKPYWYTNVGRGRWTDEIKKKIGMHASSKANAWDVF